MAEFAQDEILTFKHYNEYNMSYPIIIKRWEVRKVNGLNKHYIKVFFQKTNNKAKALKLNIVCLSAFNKQIETLDITVQDIDTKAADFLEVIPINAEVRKVQITIKQCVLTDSSVIETTTKRLVANKFIPFSEEEKDIGASLMTSAKGYPIDNMTHWFCACGALCDKDVDACINCGTTKQEVFSTITENNVKKQQEIIAQQTVTQAAAKKKKIILLSSIIGGCISLFLILFLSLWFTLPLKNVTANGMEFERQEIGTEQYYKLVRCPVEVTKAIIPSTVRGLPVRVIGEDAFFYCCSLESVTIPNSVTSIEDEAFRHCCSLKSITIPISVTSIGEDVFFGCSNMTIYCEAAVKPSGWSKHWNSGCSVVWGYKG